MNFSDISSLPSMNGQLQYVQTSLTNKEKQEKIIQEIELKRKIESVIVPTDNRKVIRALRWIGEPITLFGEREMERRERLKYLVALKDVVLPPTYGGTMYDSNIIIDNQKELFFTEGAAGLLECRKELARWSLERAKERITTSKLKFELGERFDYKEALKTICDMTSECSEIADTRPVACCQFSPDNKAVISGGWSGLLKVWTVPECKMIHEFRPHDDRLTGVAWQPNFSFSESTSDDILAYATGSADMTSRLWSKSGKMLYELNGHTDRLGRIAFHPMGRHLATTSFDLTWRFWDVNTGACLFEQEGHSRAVYTVAFQCDGSLTATGGLDAIGRIWDCRTGRSILTLQGHVKKILGMDFSPNGYMLITGSDDHTCRLWDLRVKDCMYSIPAHTSLISQVRWEQDTGAFILTTGYDNLAKLWSGKDFTQVKVLSGHEGKIMCGDISPNGSYRICTVGYDRTMKFWAMNTHEDMLEYEFNEEEDENDDEDEMEE